MSKNVWPKFGPPQGQRSPKSVIEELGAGLKESTEGLVRFYSDSPSIKGDQVVLSYTLYCLPLSYHFPFLRAKFSVQDYYPVTLVADKLEDVIATDEAELTAALTTIFNAPSTVRTIQKLMALGSDTAPF